MDDKDLDNLFAAARATPSAPAPALMDRILADALANQPAPRPASDLAPGAPLPQATRLGKRPFWEPLAALFGGTGALVGMGGAAMTGLFIGLAQPAAILSLSETYLGGTSESVALLPSVDALFSEVTE